VDRKVGAAVENLLDVDQPLVGGRTAGPCAGVAAREASASVLVVWPAQRAHRGGGTQPGALHRLAFGSVVDHSPLCD
jgi:hypothetical protein